MATNIPQSAWQFNKNVHQRNEHMFENELATDVVFRVASSFQGEAQTMCAHSYMLISASPVFWAMFCGDMREQGDVIVPDVEPEAFWQMLRYIYTDKIALTGHNVMHILHAAKKYQLPSLVQLCVNYLENELKASNACSVFEHSMFFTEPSLSQKCLEKIEQKTDEALNTEDFLSVSKATLSVILDSDKLSIPELKLFERTCDWARRKGDHSKSIREILGDCFFKIRFPIIPMKEFTEVVCQADILNKDEQLELFKYLTAPSPQTKPQAFNCEKRKPIGPRIVLGQTVRVKHSHFYRGIWNGQYLPGNMHVTPQMPLRVSSLTDTHVDVTSQHMVGTMSIPLVNITTEV